MTVQWREYPITTPFLSFLPKTISHWQIHDEPLPAIGLYGSVTVDEKNLQAYCSVCELKDTVYLPPLYPHILAFKLQLALLTDKAFPFPLLGIIHLENRIRVLQPMTGIGPYTILVTAEDLQPYTQGAAFTIVTKVMQQQGIVWEAYSRVLCKKATIAGEPPAKKRGERLEQSVIAQWSAPSNIGRRYAKVSNDYNPIHLSALSARAFGFERAIAHGLWAKAKCLDALSSYLPLSGYEISVRFQKPILLPSELALKASLPGDHGQFSLRGGKGRPHLSGKWQLLS